MKKFESEIMTSAFREMWLDPHDDFHSLLKPVRLNRLQGNVGHLDLTFADYYLPTVNDRYVVYMLNAINRQHLGISETFYESFNWIRLDKLSKDNELIISLIAKDLKLPLTAAYLRINERSNVLIAIDTKATNDLLQDSDYPLYVQFFKNDWIAQNNTDTYIDHYSIRIEATSDYNDIADIWRNQTTNNMLLFKNGYYVNDLTAGELAENDIVALDIDRTGLGYVDYPINELSTYHSVMHSNAKYLLQLDLGDRYAVCPLDELDIYICARQDNVGNYPRYAGVYFTQTDTTDAIQLTHQDIGLSVLRIDEIIERHRDVINMDNPFIRIFFRQTTEISKLPAQLDGDFIMDLFRFEAGYRKSLMLDTLSNYSGWRCSTLEQSPYKKWRDGEYSFLTKDAIKGVYSYEELNYRALSGFSYLHKLSKIGLDGKRSYTVPFIKEIGCGILGYDATGKLVQIIKVDPTTSPVSVKFNGEVTSVRVLPGSMSTQAVDWDRDMDSIGNSDIVAEQFYYQEDGSDSWKVAREGDNYYVDPDDDTYMWLSSHLEDSWMRRTVRDSLHRTIHLDTELLYHPFNIYGTKPPPTLLRLSHLEIYLDGRYLTEGVDYLVKYPFIHLNAKEYFLDKLDHTARVDIFHYGLPDDLTYKQDFDFVRYGKLYEYSKTELSLYRRRNFFVDGYLYNESELGFRETHHVSNAPVEDGQVFCRITQPTVITTGERKRLAHKDIDRATSVAGYISSLSKAVEESGPVFIDKGHAIFSPFVWRTVQRLRDKTINSSLRVPTTGSVTLALQDWIHELEDDILSEDLNWQFIDVHPTPDNRQVEITEDDLQFLRVMNELYLNKRLTFNSYFSIVRELP